MVFQAPIPYPGESGATITGKMRGARTEKDWNEQTIAEEAKMMTRKSSLIYRSPVKGTTATSTPNAPKKPAATAIIIAENDDEEDDGPTTPTHSSPCIQVPATPSKANTHLSPSIQVHATPSGTVIQETQGSPADPFKATLQAAINLISRNKDKLANTKNVPKAIKDEVVPDLTDVISFLEGLNTMKDNMDSIKHEIREVKETILTAAKHHPTVPTSWATVAAMPRPSTQTQNHRHRHRNQEIDEENQKRQAERRLDRAKFEVTLTTKEAPQETRSKLNGLNYEQITATLQKAIDKSIPPTETPIKIGGFRILKSNDIRFTCETVEEATRLRKINWMAAYEGLVVRQPKFGIVIHGISIDEVNPHTDSLDDIASEIGERNNINIIRMRTLRAPSKIDHTARHNSFVILTHDKEAADTCLRKGVFLNCRLYNAEKYTPQYQLTQCYKCQRYGHKAGYCRGKERCGNCGKEDHGTKDCQTDRSRCVNCGDDHPAWHPDCPRRREESERLDDLKFNSKRAYFNDS